MKRKKNRSQLTIEYDSVVIRKPLKYSDLSIHEKINCKANSQGFARNYLYHGGSQEVSQRRDHFDKLTDIWFWHIDHNFGGNKSIDTEMYREKLKEVQKKLNFK